MDSLIAGVGVQTDKGVSPSIAAAAAPTVAIVIPCAGRIWLGFHFAPTVQAIDKTRVRARSHPEAEWQDFTPVSWAALPAGGFIKATAVHTTSTGAFVDGDLDTVAVTENAWFKMDVTSFTDVEVAYSAAVDGAIVPHKYSLT